MCPTLPVNVFGLHCVCTSRPCRPFRRHSWDRRPATDPDRVRVSPFYTVLCGTRFLPFLRLPGPTPSPHTHTLGVVVSQTPVRLPPSCHFFHTGRNPVLLHNNNNDKYVNLCFPSHTPPKRRRTFLGLNILYGAVSLSLSPVTHISPDTCPWWGLPPTTHTNPPGSD